MGEAAEHGVGAELDEQVRLYTQWVTEWHRPVTPPPGPAAEERAAEERRVRPVRGAFARLRGLLAG